MCRVVHTVLSTVVCGIQMLVRVFMTVILMIENIIRMILQTLYNFISFMLQVFSLIPICVVFLLTSKLKFCMCGGGGPCPARGGACDCIMSALTIIILFFIFRATGVLDKIFSSMGYAKAQPPMLARFVPARGDIADYSRNDTDYTDYTFTTMEQMMEEITYELTTPKFSSTEINITALDDMAKAISDKEKTTTFVNVNVNTSRKLKATTLNRVKSTSSDNGETNTFLTKLADNLTTILYDML